MKSVFVIPILLLLAIACSTPGANIGQSPWPASGVPEADSLMSLLEEMRSQGPHTLPERTTVARRICSLATAHPSNETLRLRSIYVAGCTLLAVDQKAAYDYVTLQTRQLDSAAAPFDWHCLRSLLLPYEKSLYTKYIIASDNVKYFASVGADIELGRNLVILGNVLCEMDDRTKALEYYARAEECFSRHGASKELYLAQLNRANASSPEEKGAILHRLLADTLVRRNPAAYALVLQNAYVHFDSAALLDQAIAILRQAPVDDGDLPLLLSYKAQDLIAMGRRQEALALADSIRRGESAKKQTARYISIINGTLAEIYLNNGLKDSCIYRLDHLIWLQDSVRRAANLPGIYSHETKRLIAIADRNARLERRALVMWWVISLLGLLTLTIWIYLTARRRQARRQHELELLGEKIENARQSQLVLANIMEGSDRMLSDIGEAIRRHCRPGDDSKLVEEIRRALAIYQSNDENRRGYLKINRELDNRFTTRLKEDFPDLSESLLRLAALIAAGIDSQQLSAILNISPKSLYTARYRLRARLGLSKEDSLEDFLRRYRNPA